MENLISFKDFLLQEKRNLIKLLIQVGIIFFIMMFTAIPLLNYLLNFYNMEVFALSVTENIDVIINFILLSTLVFTIPLIFNRIYKLIKEAYGFKLKSQIWYMSIFAVLGFGLGITFVAKEIITGLISYGIATPMISIKSVLNFAISMGFAMAFAFQLIFIIPILSKLNILKSKTILKNSMWILIGLYFIVAWITPTDLTGNLFILLPCTLSTGIGTFIAHKNENKENKIIKGDIKC